MPLLQTFGNATARAYGFGLSSAASYELISTQVLGSTTTSVTFSSIPQGYKHLQLRIVERTSTVAEESGAVLTFNGDTTSGNYGYHNLFGNGSSVNSNYSGASASINLFNSVGSTYTANAFAVKVVDILDYTSTAKNKTTRALVGYSGSTPRVAINSGLWLSTSAISSLTLTTSATLVTGSRYSLYGVRA
jgi:hypothetical protein